MRFSRSHTDIRVGAQRECLSAAEAKRNLRVQDKGMVLKESCKTVFLGQPVVIVLNSQKQIMPLRHQIPEADFNIKASKIEVVESVVVKELLADIDESVQRVGNSRLVKRCCCRRNDKIALHAAARERNI